MARITHPYPQPGTVNDRVGTQDGPVVFIDGFAEVDLTDKPILHSFYVQHGYGIDYDLDEVAEDVDINVPIGALTIKELRKVAADNGVEIPKDLRLKDDILELVETTLAERKIIADGGVVEATLEVVHTQDHPFGILPEFDPENPIRESVPLDPTED